MDFAATANQLAMSKRNRRAAIMLVALSPLVLGVLLWHGISLFGPDPPRFAALREGMTIDEVRTVLGPEKLRLLTMLELHGFEPNTRFVQFRYSEGPMYPQLEVTVLFTEGHLVRKGLRKPTFREFLEHWRAKLRQT